MTPFDRGRDSFGRAFEHGLHGTVRAVAHPTADPEAQGFPPCRGPECHTLDEATDDRANADRFRLIGQHAG